MKKVLEKVFEIPKNLKLDQVEEKPEKTILSCHVKKQKVCCKFCGGSTWGYDKRETNKHHTMVGGRQIWLRITRRRVQCKVCEKVFIEPIEGITKSKFSDHFTQQVQEKAKGRDLSSVGREMGISCAAVSSRMSALNVDLMKTPEKKA